MDWIILTGMSGAGKTTALNTLEDLGFSCVDNLPPRLLPPLADIRMHSKSPVTVVIDSRSYGGLDYLNDALGELTRRGISCKIIFLDADDATLIKRYKETRRSHPMLTNSGESLDEAISSERVKLLPLRERADYLIDTSAILPGQLKSRLISLLSSMDSESTRKMWIHCSSFGFKKGMPSDSDIVFDVRCLRNPFYIEGLKQQTGLDEAVEEYVMRDEDAVMLLNRFKELFDAWLPLFVKEGRSMLTIAIGCTGGRHRSVVFAKKLGEYLIAKGYSVGVSHRDIQR